MATCHLTNWVSVFFERSLFPFNSHINREHDSSANSLFMPDFKLYTTQLGYPVESGHPSDCMSTVDLEPPDSTVSLHIGQVSCMKFTRPMWAVLSLFHRTCVTRCVASGGTRSKLLTARSPSDILLVSVESRLRQNRNTFCCISWFFGSGHMWLSFFKGFALRYAISNLSLITYQKPPPFLKKTSRFSNSWQRTLPWANGLHA